MFSLSNPTAPGLDRLTGWQFARVAHQWATIAESMGRAEISGFAPVGKGPGAGRLRDSTQVQARISPTEVTLHFTAPVPYAGYVVAGTRPHLIRPRHMRALHWTGPDGTGRFAALVHHPGTRPNPYGTRALNELRPRLEVTFAALVRKELSR